MYKLCQTEQSAFRQRQLEEGLLKIMLHRHYEEISVSDLCEILEVPRKSFYRYFSGKDGALLALIDHTLMDYDVYTTMNGSAGTMSQQQIMEQIFSYWITQKPLLDALAYSSLSGLLVQRALERIKEIETLPNFIQIADKQLREYGTMFTVCGMMSLIIRWHHDGFAKSAQEMARLAVQLFSEPIFAAGNK